MVGDNGADYLSGLTEGQRKTLARANKPGLAKLRGRVLGMALGWRGGEVNKPGGPGATVSGYGGQVSKPRKSDQRGKISGS
jgi:hypothetical protein